MIEKRIIISGWSHRQLGQFFLGWLRLSAKYGKTIPIEALLEKHELER